MTSRVSTTTSLWLLVLAPFLTALSLGAASVTLDVDVEVPSMLVLYCFDEIDVTLSSANLASLLAGVGATGDDTQTTPLGTVTPTVVGSSLQGTVVTLDTTLAPGDSTAVFLNLLGVCAVRAVGSGNGVDMTIVSNNTTLTGPTGTILVDAVGTRRAGGAGFAAAFNIPEASLGLSNVNFVDVQLELDMSNARTAGSYSSTVDGTFTITATAP